MKVGLKKTLFTLHLHLLRLRNTKLVQYAYQAQIQTYNHFPNECQSPFQYINKNQGDDKCAQGMVITYRSLSALPMK